MSEKEDKTERKDRGPGTKVANFRIVPNKISDLFDEKEGGEFGERLKRERPKIFRNIENKLKRKYHMKSSEIKDSNWAWILSDLSIYPWSDRTQEEKKAFADRIIERRPDIESMMKETFDQGFELANQLKLKLENGRGRITTNDEDEFFKSFRPEMRRMVERERVEFVEPQSKSGNIELPYWKITLLYHPYMKEAPSAEFLLKDMNESFEHWDNSSDLGFRLDLLEIIDK